MSNAAPSPLLFEDKIVREHFKQMFYSLTILLVFLSAS